jgi:hypothetical protein
VKHRQMNMCTLVIAMAIVVVAISWLTEESRRRGKAIATAKRVGGVVQVDDQHDPELPPPEPARIDVIGWLDNTVGPQFAHCLSVVNLDGTRITDDDMVHLEGLSELRLLLVDGTNVTGAGMSAVRRAIPGLQVYQ